MDLDQISTLPIIPEAEEQKGHPGESFGGVARMRFTIHVDHW